MAGDVVWPRPPVGERCVVHDEEWQEGEVPAIASATIDWDLCEQAIRERYYPNANELAFGPGAPARVTVRYCAGCRRARHAWTSAPFDWCRKQELMEQGYDLARGELPAIPMATLVSDYAWIERCIRACAGARILPFLPSHPAAGESVEDFILREVAAARAEGAPFDVVFRDRDGWRRLADVHEPVIRDAMGLRGA